MSELRFDDRVAIITGAGGGLGKEYASLLAERGARVVVNDIGRSSADDRPGGAAEAVAAAIRSLGGEAVADVNSVATPDGGIALVQTALDSYGRIDIVVNNAGIVRDKSFANMSPEFVDAVIDVHLRGAFNVTRPAWVRMREQGYGRVVNTTSNSGLIGNFGQSNYGAAKMGLVGFTRVLALEGARLGIKVNAIAPSARTPMTDQFLDDSVDYLGPQLVAPVVAWLVHEDVPVTGEVYTVGGGRVAKFFVGMTTGWYSADLTPEEVRDHLAEISDETGYTVPASPGEELDIIASMIAASGASNPVTTA